MTHNQIKLPKFPPVPLRPMSDDTKRELVKALRGLKPDLWQLVAQDWCRKGYALIWIHLCLVERINPRDAMSTSRYAYHEILPKWLKAVETIGLHKPELAEFYWASGVAYQAYELHKGAVEAYRAGNALPLSYETPKQHRPNYRF